MYRKQITATAAAAVAIVLATGAQGGCGSTKTVDGTTDERVTCNETPYDVALDTKETGGTGIVVTRGYVRGAMWVNCVGGEPDTFSITVQLLRNGLPYGDSRGYDGIPNAVGHAVSVFEVCKPGVYRLEYRYRWTLSGAAQAKTMTVPISETVTQHDCDA